MARYLFVVLANAKDGQEEEFNDFYSNTHIPDVLKVPGMKSAERFVLAGPQRMSIPSPFKYLAIYQVETDDLASVAADIAERSGTEAMPTNQHISQNPKFAYFFQPLDGE
ncbi:MULTISPECIES: DUF4286 family protein [unclassified Chelatococcus]|uniref:DUF4286 family protein n=1 Tax=unclassified Chelatococcus TaxID=2638111 RepID=UPI001BCD434A|nr:MULTISPECIES: DUF4286 family protein [unclassified Chelatococcus]MBS7700254.1 hypothetical protein [Chelatococcus sp. YT9]MBX3558225.1 hypothetical protein [Chelatococcus sp.]